MIHGEFPEPYRESVPAPIKPKRAPRSRFPATSLPDMLAIMAARYNYVPAFDLVARVLSESDKIVLPIQNSTPAPSVIRATVAAATADLPATLAANAPAGASVASLKRVFLAVALDHKRQAEAVHHAHELAAACGILSESDKTKPDAKDLTMGQLRILAFDAAFEFQNKPTAKTFKSWLRAASRIDACVLRASDKYRASLPTLHMTHPTFGPSAPIVRSAPVSALDWQTQPVISMNPSAVHEYRHSLSNLQLYPNKGI